MPCDPNLLRDVQLFSLLDDEELGVLAGQVDQRRFGVRQQVYRAGDPGGRAYVVVSGRVVVSTVDEDNQEVVVDEPGPSDFFGFASMLDETPHHTTATAMAETVCIEVDRHDISVLLERKPMAGMDLLTILGRQIHAAQHLVRKRSMRNPNEVIEEKRTMGDRLADDLARFGGSWTFIVLFIIVVAVWAVVNVNLARRAWDPYPFILLNLFLSMLAAIQAPVILMSQNRQDEKDRLRSELDFDVNKRAEAEIRELSRKLNVISDKLEDVDQAVRHAGRSV